MIKIPWQGARFIIAGIINTIAGNGTAFILIAAGLVPEISNVLGYAVGIFISFVLNRNWVFHAQKGRISQQLSRFLICFSIAYVLNLLTLSFFYRIVAWHAYLAQLLASLVYSVVFYLLNRYITFAERKE